MRLPEGFIQEVKYRNDIEEIIARYTELKRAGIDSVARCPFHNERTPSFRVYKNSKSFYCFGCGAGGDVVTFVMRIENLDYIQAVARLAEFAKMDMPEDNGEMQGKIIKQKLIYEMNREAALYFHENLSGADGAKAREYLAGRKLKNASIKRFGLGYAPAGWDSLTKYLSDKGYSKDEQKAAGLCSVNRRGGYIDYFRGRLMFPIIDVQGRVIAFGGRALGDENGPKYLNSADSPVFKKSRNLYALNFAKNNKGSYFIMCEGYMDVISMHQAGFASAVATLGTAVTREQANLIDKYVKRVILAYDSDEAGKRAMQKAAALLGETGEAGIEVQVLPMDGAKDPDEFINKYGREKLAGHLEKPKGYTEAKLDDILAKYDLDIPGEAERAISESCTEIARMKEQVSREVYAGRLADRFKLMPDSLFAKIEAVRKKQLAAAKYEAERKSQDEIKKAGIQANSEEAILGTLLNYPEFYADVKDILSEAAFSSEFYRRVFAFVKESTETQANFDINQHFSGDEIGQITKMRLSEAATKILNRADSLKNHITEMQNKARDSINIKEIAQSGRDADFLAGFNKIKFKKTNV